MEDVAAHDELLAQVKHEHVVEGHVVAVPSEDEAVISEELARVPVSWSWSLT